MWDNLKARKPSSIPSQACSMVGLQAITSSAASLSIFQRHPQQALTSFNKPVHPNSCNNLPGWRRTVSSRFPLTCMSKKKKPKSYHNFTTFHKPLARLGQNICSRIRCSHTIFVESFFTPDFPFMLFGGDFRELSPTNEYPCSIISFPSKTPSADRF